MRYEQMRDYYPNRLCTVNGSGDLAIDPNEGKYIGKQCLIVKVTKHGLVQIRMMNCRETVSLPKRNIDLIEVTDEM